MSEPHQESVTPSSLHRNGAGPIENAIRTKLGGALSYDLLDVVNESSQHNVAPGSETHFRVLVVSSELEDENRVARHRRIHRALAEELAGGVHALAIDALTPGEWEARGERRSVSPHCLGGSKR